jgi:hypothetical protein
MQKDYKNSYVSVLNGLNDDIQLLMPTETIFLPFIVRFRKPPWFF